ncbi:MAG: cupin domain-containing protein [Gammaproteobacteria bacterium]|nr:cupin domain-containing protein [Gammaproteobacteria bacterium]
MKPQLLLLAIALALPGLPAAAHEPDKPSHVMMSPEQMQWMDLGALPPGAKGTVIQGPLDMPGPFTIRVRFPANYRIPPHWHPAIEHVTVLSGTFHMGLGEKFDRNATMALTAGSVGIMAPKTAHFAWTDGATEVQLHGVGPWDIIYVDPADDPRKRAVKDAAK